MSDKNNNNVYFHLMCTQCELFYFHCIHTRPATQSPFSNTEKFNFLLFIRADGKTPVTKAHGAAVLASVGAQARVKWEIETANETFLLWI